MKNSEDTGHTINTESESNFADLFMQAPAVIAVLRGPNHIFDLCNPMYMQLVGQGRNIIGKPLEEALPEVKEQGFIDLLDRVYNTGEPFVGNEIPAMLDRDGNGKLEQLYLNFVYQPIKNKEGEIQGVFAHGVDVTELVLSRKAIAESEEKYRSLFETMDQGFCLIEMIFDSNNHPVDYKFLEVNPVFERQTGLKDAAGKTAKELIPDLEAHWFERYGKVAATGESVRFVEGSAVMGRWFEVYAFKFGKSKGNKVALLFTDITERKQNEEALKQGEKLIRLINDSIPAFISYVDANERYVFVNRAYENYFGNVQGKYVCDVVDEATYKRSKPAIKKVLTGERIIFENSLELKDGVMELEVKYVPDISDDGSVRGFVVLAHDISDRKRVEEALRESATRFKTYAEAMPQMAFMADAEGNIIYYNQRWYNYIGNLENTEGWGWKDQPIHHPADIQKAIDTWKLSVETGESYEIEYRLRKHTGEYRWHLGRAVPVRDKNGKIELWLGSNTDIHLQKQAEEALRRSEEYYKTMTDNTPIMTRITRPDGSCTYLNKQWYKYSGRSPEEGLGFGWLQVVHPDDTVKAEEIFVKANQQQVPFSFEYRLKSGYGEYRWHLDSGLPKFDDEGNYEGMIGAVIDIHERKITEEKLRESEEFSRTLLESSPDCVKALDMDGKVLSINPQGLKMLEIDGPDDYKGRSWLSFWKDSDHYREAEIAIEKAVRGEIGHFSGFNPTTKGSPMWWDVLIAPVYDAEQNVERLISVSRDISKLKELEQQKDDFIGIASHELKTPVTSIKAYTQVLQNRFNKAEDTKSAEMLGKMDGQINKLTGLISDLLDVTKIEQGKLQFRKEEFEFGALVNEVVEEIQRTTTRHNILNESRESCKVTGDRERIGQVITNFLTNAIKYSPQADKVMVNTEIDDDRLLLSVTDYGVGLSETDQTKVFERFYRVGGAGYETFPGLGLGLFISAEIIRRHGGEMWVESKKGDGSTFYFSLRLNQESSGMDGDMV